MLHLKTLPELTSLFASTLRCNVTVNSYVAVSYGILIYVELGEAL